MRLSEKGHTYALFAIVVITCALGSLSQTATNSMRTGICAEFFIDAGEGQWLTTVCLLYTSGSLRYTRPIGNGRERAHV